ncbi:MAG TPA: penicillin acylase family protein, partial [Chitinophagaceae bacterium]|nr:penicillin acylase family protein [Chitinophagaceae bacterium]
DIVKSWDLLATAESEGQTVYTFWWGSLRKIIWDHLTRDAGNLKNKIPAMGAQALLEILKRDSSFMYKGTTAQDSLSGNNPVTLALKEATQKIDEALAKAGGKGLAWKKFNKPGVYHLLDKSKKDLLPFDRPNLDVGGAGDIVNAISGSHGPSWRMIVQMSAQTEAYGLYPGGQSGNPGSKYYDNMIDYWVQGKYYKLWFMQDADRTSSNIKWTMSFSKK